MRLAILGLGGMGQAFASRALERGHDVVGWNRTPREFDLPTVSTPLEAVRGADVVQVIVADGDAVRSLCTPELLTELPASAVLMVTSTVAPATVRAIELPERVVDAPVLGSPEAIASGGGRFYVGGADDAVARVLPLLDDLGTTATHCGPLGSGAVLKIVSNLQLVIGVAATAEAIAIARGHGLPDGLLREVLHDSPVVSPTSRLRLDNVIDPAHPGWFRPALAAKDIRLALSLAREAEVVSALGPAALWLLDRVTPCDWDDFAAVIEGL